MPIPQHKNRSPDQILNAGRLFDSAWHFWQALSWVDHAKRNTSISALQYAALELRQGVEHLWFDMIVTSVGGELDIREYSRCKGDSTKMYIIAKKNGVVLVLQCKLWDTPVGNKAVQEIAAARGHYFANGAAVVSNQSYTAAAKVLAQSNRVLLLHHSDLEKLLTI